MLPCFLQDDQDLQPQSGPSAGKPLGLLIAWLRDLPIHSTKS